MARPARVRIRRRKPCFLARRRLFGWKVRLLTTDSKGHSGKYTAWHRRCRSKAASSAVAPQETGHSKTPHETASQRYVAQASSVKLHGAIHRSYPLYGSEPPCRTTIARSPAQPDTHMRCPKVHWPGLTMTIHRSSHMTTHSPVPFIHSFADRLRTSTTALLASISAFEATAVFADPQSVDNDVDHQDRYG